MKITIEVNAPEEAARVLGPVDRGTEPGVQPPARATEPAESAGPYLELPGGASAPETGVEQAEALDAGAFGAASFVESEQRVQQQEVAAVSAGGPSPAIADVFELPSRIVRKRTR